MAERRETTALEQAVDTKDLLFMKEFLLRGDEEKTGEVRKLDLVYTVRLLELLCDMKDAHFSEELISSYKLIVTQHFDKSSDPAFRDSVKRFCDGLSKRCMSIDKLHKLKGKLDFLIFKAALDENSNKD